MRGKSPLENLLPPELAMFSEPILLNGAHIKRLTDTQQLHTTEIGLGLGVNTAGLYTKFGNPDPVKSSVAILLRLYAAFPELLPKVHLPEVDDFMAKIMAIDPDFKKSHLGPLLGLETNSSFRLHKGFDEASQTAKMLVYLINRLIDMDPENWWVVRDTIQIEAEASGIEPAKSVWTKGGWSRNRVKKESIVTKKAPVRKTAPSPTAKAPKRVAKPKQTQE